MMPGSVLDKTNNLNMLECIPTNITHKPESFKEYSKSRLVISDESKNIDHESTILDMLVVSEIKNSFALDEKCEYLSNLYINTTKLKFRKENKILAFLKKYKITQKELGEKIKNIRRCTRDKANPNRVISVKLKRYDLKQLKLRRKKRIELRNKILKKTVKKKVYSKTEITSKNKEETAPSTMLAIVKQEQETCTKQDVICEKKSSDEILSTFSVLSRLQADDDIRNKIKQQLQLLRKNKKALHREEARNCKEADTKEASTSAPANDKTAASRPIPANLSDVLISNESELSIVSVVGGYISDEENECKPSSELAQDIQATNCDIEAQPVTNHLGKGTSIADFLLQRDLNSNDAIKREYLDQPESNPITPTKTNDITKIKGWRRKQFGDKINMIANAKREHDMECTNESTVDSEESSQSKCIIDNHMSRKYYDEPIPSTSTCIPKLEPKTRSSVEPDNILKQGEYLTLYENKKSAFVSDQLDIFLNYHSKLKISYEVPKLVAEEAISKPACELPIALRGNTSYSNTMKQRRNFKKNMLKPKTVAEKRRMLELDRKNKLMTSMKTNERGYLKQLESSEADIKSNVAKNIVEEMLVNQQVPLSKRCWHEATKCGKEFRQFVFVGGRKIRIVGSAGGKDLIVSDQLERRSQTSASDTSKQDSMPRKCLLNRFSKPSLINVSPKKDKLRLFKPMQYKPGPLCKKRKLARSFERDENWECRVLTMPKIKLVAYPEQGKPFPVLAEKYLQLCKNEEGFISNEWAKFAVSAVQSDENTKTKVEFELPYANRQNKLLVRKRICKITSTSSQRNASKFYDGDVEEDIKTVVSGMLDCIQNQELDKTIIKDDPDLNYLSQGADKRDYRPPSPIDAMVQAIIKRPNAKRSKTTLELRRLNVQVIEVDVKDEEAEVMNCKKEYCSMGCVCKSLRGLGGIVPQHCGQELCMLACTCSFNTLPHGHHSITLPAGTDLLSASTVVRLQDEVKKNLAKEEREFTQTVIKANNQTIMVGGGARERQRRVSKVPKKYSNYVQKSKGLSYMEMISNGLLEDIVASDDLSNGPIEKRINEESNNTSDVKKPVPIWKKNENKAKKECFVTLERLKHLDKVLPWCMVHNLYKCHCGGNATDNYIKPKVEEEIIEKIKTEEIDTSPNCTSYAPRNVSRSVSESSVIACAREVSDKYCARTRPLATSYYQTRNKTPTFKARYAKIRAQEEKCNVDFDMCRPPEDNNDATSENEQANSNFDFRDVFEEPELLTRKKPKKMTIANVDDIVQPAKSVKPKPTIIEDKTPIVSASSFVDYDRSFMGILTPSKEWLNKFQKMLSLNFSNTIIHQIRLLEWATLVKRQKEGSLQMWFNNRKHNNIILTEDRKRPSRSHMNVKLFENTQLDNMRVPEIITSLFKAKLPGSAKNDHDTYVILVYNGLHWEARGTIVLNNTSEMCRHRLTNKPTPATILSPDLCNEKVIKKVSLPQMRIATKEKAVTAKDMPALFIKSTPAMSVEVVSGTSKPEIKIGNKSMEITKLPCKTEITIKPSIPDIKPSTESQSSKYKLGSILAPLPTGLGLNRWFLLLMDNDFSVLKITFTNFHIKYTHLLTAINMARLNRKTVRVRCQGKSCESIYDNFGIYAIPGFIDRVFFGPYEDDADHGLETFRYVNGRLLNTKVYNKMRGITDRKSPGIWFTHNSTVNNNLNLELQHMDTYSPSIDCSTELISPENATKPQIEFVDLTGNDSDPEIIPQEQPIQSYVDPLFNVLSADFTKKVSSDITIEPVYDIQSKILKPNSIRDYKADVVIRHVKNVKADVKPLEKKRPLITKEDIIVSPKKRKLMITSTQKITKLPVVIDNINLDLDDSTNKLSSEQSGSNKKTELITIEPLVTNDKRQVPKLFPISKFESTDIEELKKLGNMQGNKPKIYIITNIPGIGYFEVILYKKKYCVPLAVKNRDVTGFNSLAMVIRWLDLLLQKHIYIMPQTLKIRFSVLENEEAPDMSKFNEIYLDGYHMICEKGIFDLMRMSTNEMEELGFQENETTKLLAHKCELLLDRNTKVPTPEAINAAETPKLDKLNMKITPGQESRERNATEKNGEQEPFTKMRSVLREVPESVRTVIKQEIVPIVSNESKLLTETTSTSHEMDIQATDVTGNVNPSKFPAGKICKIVNGRMLVMDQSKAQNSKTKPFPVNLLSRATVKRLFGRKENNSKYELIVPITGLEKPAKVVGIPPDTPATSLLLSKQKLFPNVVDLTDD